MLQLMLAGHPDIATTSEPWIALHPLFALRKKGIDTVYDSSLALNAMEEVLKQSGTDEVFYKKQIRTFLLSFYEKAIKHQKKKTFLDKTPRYYHIIPELMEIFPAAKFIILFRNPLAVLNSILKTWIKDDLPRLGNYKDDLMIAPQKLVDCVKEHPDRCLKVKYEELIVNTGSILKKICGYLGISYYENMVNYGSRLNTEWKFGDKVGVRKAIRPTAGNMDKWEKGFISTQEKHFAQSYLKELGPELVKEMGYDFDEVESLVSGPAEKMRKELISWNVLMDEGTDINRHVRKVNRLTEERDALLNSISWKVTKPLRIIYDYFIRK